MNKQAYIAPIVIAQKAATMTAGATIEKTIGKILRSPEQPPGRPMKLVVKKAVLQSRPFVLRDPLQFAP